MNVEVNHPKLSVNFGAERVYPELEDLEVTPTNEEQNFKSSKYGFNNVKVKRIETEELTITPTEEEQVFTGLFDKVTCEKAELEKPIDLPLEFEIDNIGNFVEIKLSGNNKIEVKDEKTAIITVNEKNNVSVIEKEKTYTELNYIETTGTQYINTGVAIFNYNSWEIELDILFPSASGTKYIYSTASDDSKYVCDYFKITGDEAVNITPRYNGTGTSTRGYTELNKRVTMNVKYTGILEMSITDNGTKKSGTITTALLNSPLYILRKGSAYATARIYGIKLYTNGELIRNYIPVKDLIGVPCLYDKVTETFLYNAGTGEFLTG